MRNSSVCLRCNGDARCEVASATAFLSSSAGTASPLRPSLRRPRSRR